MTNYYVVKRPIWYRPDQKRYYNGTVTLDHLTDIEKQRLLEMGVVEPYISPKKSVKRSKSNELL